MGTAKMKSEDTQADKELDLSVSLREIQRMLKEESDRWFSSQRSSTADWIMKYLEAIDILLSFIEAKDVKSFVYTFAKYSITMDGIRKCFYNNGTNVAAKRNRARRLFANVCSRMITTLSAEVIRAKAASWQINEQSARNFFKGQFEEAQAQEPEGEDGLTDFK